MFTPAKTPKKLAKKTPNTVKKLSCAGFESPPNFVQSVPSYDELEFRRKLVILKPTIPCSETLFKLLA